MHKKSNFNLDFVGIGTGKAGTTWAAKMLRQHPHIFVPRKKELHYFNRQFNEYPQIKNFQFDKPLSWYSSFFKEALDEQIKGEISPSYLWDDSAPYRIQDVFPNVKIFAILRNPIERTFSHFLYCKQKGTLKAKNIKVATQEAPYLIERSLYHNQVKRYLDIFPKSQIYISFFDDLKKDSKEFIIQLEKFLGVKTFIPDNYNKRSNITETPKLPLLNRFLYLTRTQIRKSNNKFLIDTLRKMGLARLGEKIRNDLTKPLEEKPVLSNRNRKWLKNIFLNDIKKLEKLLNKDLSHWK